MSTQQKEQEPMELQVIEKETEKANRDSADTEVSSATT